MKYASQAVHVFSFASQIKPTPLSSGWDDWEKAARDPFNSRPRSTDCDLGHYTETCCFPALTGAAKMPHPNFTFHNKPRVLNGVVSKFF